LLFALAKEAGKDVGEVHQSLKLKNFLAKGDELTTTALEFLKLWHFTLHCNSLYAP